MPALIKRSITVHGYSNKIQRDFAAVPAEVRHSRHRRFIGTAFDSQSPHCPDNCIDYIFTDPPFGENIYYADLNFLWNLAQGLDQRRPEAIVDEFKKKGLPEYQHLMQRCFEEYYRVLKPGRWMTVVFHNSRNAVWNAIQEAMQAAGFVVADVRTLDKQQGSFNR